ncbi:MAG: DUF6788 family protein [Actinomycetota bacterium]
MRLSPDQKAEVRRITAELAAIARTGQVLPGNINERMQTCGQPNCGCHADPPRRHGPYWIWTRKVAAKTVSRWLAPGQSADYQPWVNNSRRLRQLVASLEAVGASVLEADPRTARGSKRRKRGAPKNSG